MGVCGTLPSIDCLHLYIDGRVDNSGHMEASVAEMATKGFYGEEPQTSLYQLTIWTKIINKFSKLITVSLDIIFASSTRAHKHTHTHVDVLKTVYMDS